MVVLKWRNRRGSLRPFCGSLLAGLILGILASEALSAEPAAVKAPNEPKASAPAAAPASAPAAEQQYDEDLTVDTPEVKRLRYYVDKILLATTFGPKEQNVFDEYFGKHALPRWTQLKNLGSVGGYRKELRIQLLRAKSQQAHDYLRDMALEYMKKLLAGRYHPGVQVNAMLMIGELNADEYTSRPLPAALPLLLAAAGNEKLSDGIRAAAMVGIWRHAALGIEDEAARRTVSTAMLKLVAAIDPPGNPAALPPPSGRQWICRRAIDVLGLLGPVGEQNAVFNAILKTLADAKLSLDTHCTAAETLGRLNYAGAAGLNAADALPALGRFVVDACNEQPRLVAANPELDATYFRRWMLQHLVAAYTALTGVDASHRGIGPLLREGEQRTSGDELQKALKAKIDFIEDPKHVEEDIAPQVEDLKKTLEAWLQKKPK